MPTKRAVGRFSIFRKTSGDAYVYRKVSCGAWFGLRQLRAGWVSWIHEREWRCRGEFVLPTGLLGVLVRNTGDAKKLQKRIEQEPEKFKVILKSIIPLSVLCQGLPKF